MERGGRLAAKEQVTDAILDKCKPIAGTPADCIAAIEEYRDAGCTHVMLELWGDDRLAQIELFGRTSCRTSARDVQSTATASSTGRAARSRRRASPASEGAMAELMAETFDGMGLHVQWQQVEDGRANVLGIREGAGGAPSLMFNGHMDTSYSGREPWLRHVRGFQPDPFVQDGRLYGLGISNMKGALACYVEALRALADAGVTLRGDVMIAAVCGEIEKTQYGDAQGAEFRGYAAGSRYLVTHGGVADMCVLGEPTEGKVVLGHFGSLWLRISRTGDFIHTAFSEGRRDRNSILRMREVLDAVLEWIPSGRETRRTRTAARRRSSTSARSRAASAGASRGRRTAPTSSSTCACRRRSRWRWRAARSWTWCAASRSGFRTTASRARSTSPRPGAEIEESHPLVAAIDASHEEVFGAAPERDVTRWFSDASALTRYGIATVNYGTSTGLLDTVLGENLDIDGLVQTAEVYARIAQRVCACSTIGFRSTSTRSTTPLTSRPGRWRSGRRCGR